MVFKTSKVSWSLPLFLLASTTTARAETSEETAEYLLSVIAQYKAFPAIDPDPSIWETGDLNPIEVFAIQTVISIDAIAPGSSEFTATTRASYYWTADDCNQTDAHQFACDTTLSDGEGLRFFNSASAKDLPTRLLSFEEENIHRTVFEEDGRTDLIMNAQQVEARSRYSHSFDMRYYPWEIHALEIPLTSLYTTNIVKVTRFPNNIEAQIAPSVPNGKCSHQASSKNLPRCPRVALNHVVDIHHICRVGVPWNPVSDLYWQQQRTI
jgi:hypothetical protein